MKNEGFYRYKGYCIVPKRDFGTTGHLINGRSVKKGWVVIRNSCNAMPGATWFLTIAKAKAAINVLLDVHGNVQRFWEIMQPFPYQRVGQKVPDVEFGVIKKGRFLAVIENHRVVRLKCHEHVQACA